MKRFGFLYDKVYDIENLRLAYRHAKAKKGYYEEVKQIENGTYPIDEKYNQYEGIDKYLHKIQDDLINKTYKTSSYTVFYKKESDKIRKIYKLPFYPDRIVQWALIQIIGPYMERTFIADTYSSIKHRGIHYGLKRLKRAIKTDIENCQYCLKFDIRHYYQSINHEILKSQYRRIFKDKDILWLVDEICDSVSTADDEDLIRIYGKVDKSIQTGIPIGNYVSQFSANLYLTGFDHYAKEILHINHYFRQMDDIVILSNSKQELHTWFELLRDYAYDNLRLTIKPNYQIFPSFIRGIDFLGYRTFKEFTLLRKGTCLRMKNAYRKIAPKPNISLHDFCVINSYAGILMWCNSFCLQCKYMNHLVLQALLYYNTHIGGLKHG